MFLPLNATSTQLVHFALEANECELSILTCDQLTSPMPKFCISSAIAVVKKALICRANVLVPQCIKFCANRGKPSAHFYPHVRAVLACCVIRTLELSLRQSYCM